MTASVDITPEHMKIVCGILRKHLPHNVNVWVFGSRADWTTKKSSDLDLALEGDDKIQYKIIHALARDFDDSTLPYAVDVIDLNQTSDIFRQIVDLQKKVLIYDTNIPDGNIVRS